MKPLVAVALMAATPVAAFDTMTAAMCQGVLDRGEALVAPDRPEAGRFEEQTTATSDGWCRIVGDVMGAGDRYFDALEWRMQDTARWTQDGLPPLALQIRVTGVDPDLLEDSAPTDRPPLVAEATIRQEPQTGQLVLERASLSNDAGDAVSLSGVIDRVFLTSQSMMQVSLGSAVLRNVLFSMTLEGTHENPFGFPVDVAVRGDPAARRAAVFDLISRLPDGVVSPAARAELMAYAGDLPAPAGRLEVSFASERGLGLMQLGASAAMTMGPDGAGRLDADRAQAAVLLDGVTIGADWTPAARAAE